MTSVIRPIPSSHHEQPFLKELIARQHGNESFPSPRSSLDEETPRMSDVQMVTEAGGHDFDQQDLLPTFGTLPLPKSQRGESEGSKGLTADLLSFEGDSPLATLVSSTKLYGREYEQQLLARAFAKTMTQKAPRKPELVLLSGPAGTGKTRLAESLRTKVVQAGGFFCSGKFDQHQHEPFAPIVAAFNDYVRQIMQADDKTIRTVRQSIRSSVDGDLGALARMMPPLATLMEEDLQNCENTPDSCQQCNQKAGRSTFSLHKLFRAICSRERPLVMLLDDIQWASRCPLAKLRVMIDDDMNEGILFLGVCRDDVTSTSELSSFLRSLENDMVTITNIPVGNLEVKHVEDLTNEVFMMPQKQSKSLAKYIFGQSSGNAYFVVELLKMLQQEPGFLKYNSQTSSWEENPALVRKAICTCPRTFLERKLLAAPRDVQKVLMVASCLGSNITERLLEVALQEPLENRFKELVKKRKFVYDETRQTYSFQHNAFQSACYDLISAELQPAFQLEIGLRLWKHLSQNELDKNLFLVLNLIRQGSHLLRDQHTRYDIAALCIAAAEKAATRFGFLTASDYLQFAFTLLGTNHWDVAYDLSLALFSSAAEVEFAKGDSDKVDIFIDEVLTHAKGCPDKLRVFYTRIYVLGVRGEMGKAIEIGICCLKMLGINIKQHYNSAEIAWTMGQVARRLRGKSDPMIKRLQPMTNEQKLASMQVLNLLFLNSYISRKDLFPIIVLKMMKLTLFDGISAISAVAFAGYGTLLCTCGQIESGLRYGKLALELIEEWGAESFHARVAAFFWGAIVVQTRPLNESLPHLKEGHRIGLKTGDTEFAIVNAHHHAFFMLGSGTMTISAMAEQFDKLRDLTILHGHSKQLASLDPFLTFLEILGSPNGCMHDSWTGIEKALKSHNPLELRLAYGTRLFLSVALQEYESGIEIIKKRDSEIPTNEGCENNVFTRYVDALVYFANARRTSVSKERNRMLKRARACMRVVKPFTKCNPTVSLGKFVLLEAEDAASRNKSLLATEKYDHAIALAAKYGSYVELAFANQAAGEYYHLSPVGKDKAISSFEEALKAYEQWQALAAATCLRTKISMLG